MTSQNISSITNIEPWFIPLDIIMIFCTSLPLLIAIIFLITIISDKTCHTIPMMLMANSCLTEIFFGSVMFTSALFTLQNDLKQSQSVDSLCILRGFLGYAVTFLKNWSYFLQALYRYITVVYPNHLSWQTIRIQLILICFIWIFGFICVLPYILTNDIQYLVDDQICQMPLRLTFLAIYNALCVYMIPIALIGVIYFKLITYVGSMNKRVTPIGLISRAQRELKMVRRLVILVNSLAAIGVPYALFVFWSFFTSPPKYHFRIAYIFVDVSYTFVMICLVQFTDPVKKSLMRIKRQNPNQVMATRN